MRNILLAVALCAASAGQATPPAAVWPTRGWTTASPASQGFDPASFERLDADIRAGVYGNVDHLFVARRGYAVIDTRFPRDYQAISRGRSGPLGCGAGCTDAAAMHEYN